MAYDENTGKYVCPCGMNHAYRSLCPQEYVKPDLHGDYITNKIAERGYPGLGPTTSQADVMMAKANEPHMYGVGSIGPGDIRVPRCEWCLNPLILGAVHDCYEKRNGINLSHIEPEKVLEVQKQPAVWVERVANNKCTYEIQNIPNEQALRVIQDVLPKVLELWMKKSKDYGGTSGGLGPKAPFVDIWRKVIKLKRSLWHGEELQFEQNDELLKDLIGTCFNVLDEMRTDQ